MSSTTCSCSSSYCAVEWTPTPIASNLWNEYGLGAFAAVRLAAEVLESPQVRPSPGARRQALAMLEGLSFDGAPLLHAFGGFVSDLAARRRSRSSGPG